MPGLCRIQAIRLPAGTYRGQSLPPSVSLPDTHRRKGSKKVRPASVFYRFFTAASLISLLYFRFFHYRLFIRLSVLYPILCVFSSGFLPCMGTLPGIAAAGSSPAVSSGQSSCRMFRRRCVLSAHRKAIDCCGLKFLPRRYSSARELRNV